MADVADQVVRKFTYLAGHPGHRIPDRTLSEVNPLFRLMGPGISLTAHSLRELLDQAEELDRRQREQRAG